MSKLTLIPSQPPIQWVSGALPLVIKWLGQEVNHSPLSLAKVKNKWASTFNLPIHPHAIKRDNFYFLTFYRI